MNLDDIPAGSLCVIDTNVLLYAEQGASLQAQRLLRRIERQDVLGVLPQPVWQELTHKLMLAEAFMLGQITGGNPARQLSSKPDVVKRFRFTVIRLKPWRPSDSLSSHVPKRICWTRLSTFRTATDS